MLILFDQYGSCSRMHRDLDPGTLSRKTSFVRGQGILAATISQGAQGYFNSRSTTRRSKERALSHYFR
jgi:hypothetical protein